MGDKNHSQKWARFRFSVIGPLLTAPPRRGELSLRLDELSSTVWKHPITGADTRFGRSTIEAWYYRARREQDPVRCLRPKLRKDSGRTSLSEALTAQLRSQYAAHPSWSVLLHYDNLEARLKSEPELAPLPSYSTVRRYMRSEGLLKKRRSKRLRELPGEERARARLESREVRSYEVEEVGALWHLDFHHGSLPVLVASGERKRPIALGVLDDHSRLLCHLQWYLTETAEDLVHGLCQALSKRGLPRALLTDNGPAMVAEEVRSGLERLGVVHETTLPYSPHQNGKQEVFWASLEGRLVAMLDRVEDLDLALLNRASQAWVEREYNQSTHRELATSPLERFLDAPNVLRECPRSETLRQAFRRDVDRRQRRSDGTVTVDGRRFEVPREYQTLRDLRIRYARWDYGFVDLVDPKADKILSRLWLLDKAKNADRRRRTLDGQAASEAAEMPATDTADEALPPLLEELLEEYSATGAPPAYLPKDEERADPRKSQDHDPERERTSP